MEMSTHTPQAPGPDPAAAGQDLLAQATQSSREHTDQRWVQISDRVLTRALQATRSSLPVRAQAASGTVRVSEQVLVAYLHEAVKTVADVRIHDIVISTDGVDTYAGVTIAVSARFGVPLIPLADTVRSLATDRLIELLGPIAPPVTVASMHVHVQDIDPDLGPS